jgi:hypothetical protein
MERASAHACQFAEFAKLHGSTDLKPAALHVEEFASHWLASHGSHCRMPAARSKIAEEARNPVRQMLRLALEGRVTAARQRKSFPFGDRNAAWWFRLSRLTAVTLDDIVIFRSLLNPLAVMGVLVFIFARMFSSDRIKRLGIPCGVEPFAAVPSHAAAPADSELITSADFKEVSEAYQGEPNATLRRRALTDTGTTENILTCCIANSQ